ncbi:MAG: hypothetical protein JO117_02030 [Verrucomicrobia bacterium]|nr:hypothetical protein [Verrucomicrobiota bacterium]
MIKTLGLSGALMFGEILCERLEDMEDSELVDTLQGLITEDYVITDASWIRRIEDVEKVKFKVNSVVLKELRDALHPQRERGRERRRRRS